MSGLTSDVFDEHLVDESSQYMLDDLQLAAELGKTLLERNKELEATLKHHQNIIDDHVQEIEYLTKQNAALREVNDSRMKIYEQLEVSIQDLERDKYKLALEYQAEKKNVKQLCSNIESLETKVEELTKSLEDARRQAEANRRTKQTERLLSQQQQQSPGLPIIKLNSQTSHAPKDAIPVVTPQEDATTSRQKDEPCQQAGPVLPSQDGDDNQEDRDGGTGTEDHTLSEDNEEVLRLMQELQRTQKCLLSEQGKVGELEEQLAAIAQENAALQAKLQNAGTPEIKSVFNELSMLDEFRHGCPRCLRDISEQPDNDSIITGTEDDDASLMELINNVDIPKMYRSSVTIEVEPWKPDSLDLSAKECAGPTNPYRELVEKYEALLEVHRQPIVRKSTTTSAGAATATLGSGNNTPVDSCQPQQLLGDSVDGEPAPRYMIQFNPAIVACDAQERHAGEQGIRVAAVAATECSETETASSGYSDEVSNKATQTDESPRNFLCTIADGKDWRFSIYEDESAIDSRFRFSPAHRELFREIFSVLRKAAENRDEGDQLPLLDDTKPIGGGVVAGRGTTNPVPPVTPANEEPPGRFGIEEEDEDDDETVSFISSSAVSEQSFAMSECITKSERRRIARQAKAASRYGEGEPKPLESHLADETSQRQQQHQQQTLPGTADGPAQLDYIAVTVGVRKPKSRRRSHRRESNQSVGLTPPTPPRTGSARKHRPSFRPWNPDRDGANVTTGEWNGNSMTVYNRAISKPGPPAPGSPTAPLQDFANTSQSAPPKSRRTGEKKRSTTGLRNRYADLMDDAHGDEVVEFRPSTASQHLHKLQKLDLSYAEVLRRADGSNPFPARRPYNKQQ
uniref:Cerebellar degeneration-related protein 2-like n=1 Tax=Anopheles minimus TaxID=112268 RepID=A0A182W5R7_9DIPT